MTQAVLLRWPGCVCAWWSRPCHRCPTLNSSALSCVNQLVVWRVTQWDGLQWDGLQWDGLQWDGLLYSAAPLTFPLWPTRASFPPPLPLVKLISTELDKMTTVSDLVQLLHLSTYHNPTTMYNVTLRSSEMVLTWCNNPNCFNCSVCNDEGSPTVLWCFAVLLCYFHTVLVC